LKGKRMNPRLVMIEALTSGAGLELLRAAHHRVPNVTFVTCDPERYRADPIRSILTSGAVDVRVCDTRSTASLAETLSELRADGEFTLIVPNEQFLLPAAQCADKLGLSFLPLETIQLLRDKNCFRKRCASWGVPAPESIATPAVEAALAAADRISYPVVLKPSVGTGSYGVISAVNAADLRNKFPMVLAEASVEGGVPLTEEFAVGPVVSAEVLVSGGKTHVLGISDRLMSNVPYFLELRIRFPVQLAPDTRREIERICGDLVKLLDYESGPAHIEFALTVSGPKVIEFNPRFAGRNVPRLVAAALDWDVFGAVVDSYLGTSIDVPLPKAAAAERALYAQQRGTFLGVDGIELARRVAGLQEIQIARRAGDPLIAAQDQRSEYGLLWCVGATVDEAGMLADTAAGYLCPEVSAC
jgi:biotin carboxylase